MQLSVIVPVYNGERYLRECLDSLTRQGFEKDKHEVIVVNDGSTDGTENIIDDYCKRYDYFVKVTKNNGGVSSARNLGIDYATGEYVAFIDADDMFADGGYRTLLEICYKEQLDAVFYNITENKEELNNTKNLKEYKVQKNFFDAWVTHGVYKSDLIKNKIMFETSIAYGEDTLFMVTLYNEFSRVICFQNACLYYYRKHSCSTTGTIYSDERSWYLREISVIIQTKKVYELCKRPDFVNPWRDAKEYSSALILYALTAYKRNKYYGKRIVKDLRRGGVRLSEIKYKDIAWLGDGRNTFRQRVRYVLNYLVYHYSFMYRLASWFYRVFK